MITRQCHGKGNWVSRMGWPPSAGPIPIKGSLIDGVTLWCCRLRYNRVILNQQSRSLADQHVGQCTYQAHIAPPSPKVQKSSRFSRDADHGLIVTLKVNCHVDKGHGATKMTEKKVPADSVSSPRIIRYRCHVTSRIFQQLRKCVGGPAYHFESGVLHFDTIGTRLWLGGRWQISSEGGAHAGPFSFESRTIGPTWHPSCVGNRQCQDSTRMSRRHSTCFCGGRGLLRAR